LFRAPELSYSDFISDKWMAISRGLGLNAGEAQAAVDELNDLIRPWGSRRLGERCEYPSFLSHDGFPAEMSLSWRDGRPELRVLFESLGVDADPWSSQEAGRELTRRLADKPGVSVDRYLKVEDLFLSETPALYRPTVWHSLAWRPGEPFQYKVYLNPQAQGADRACEVVTEAMDRMGMRQAWQPVAERHAELTAQGHELEFFALDLRPEAQARVKVYYRHGRMPVAELGAVAALARTHDPVRAGRVLDTVYRDHDGQVTNEPMTCLAFRAEGNGPDEANLYLRFPGNTASDAEAADRVAEVMRAEAIDPEPYLTMLDALAPEPLAGITGLQELLSYRTRNGDAPADVGVYFRFSVYDTPVVI